MPTTIVPGGRITGSNCADAASGVTAKLADLIDGSFPSTAESAVLAGLRERHTAKRRHTRNRVHTHRAAPAGTDPNVAPFGPDAILSVTVELSLVTIFPSESSTYTITPGAIVCPATIPLG